MIDEDKKFTLVLRKDIFKMTRELQEAFNFLVNIDRDLSEKLNGDTYRKFTYVLNDFDRVFRRLEYYDQYGDIFVRKEVKEDDDNE